MKRTIREYFKACESCNSTGEIALGFEEQIRVCNVCDGSGRINVEETIEESDDMKEFIEKKCGWVLMEPVKEVSWRKITFN